jgi:hypothetical protein
MNTKIIFPLVGLFLLSALTPLNGQGITVQKDITVEEWEVQDNVVSFGGTIHIKGKVTEAVIGFGGHIIIEGEVDQTVVGFGSIISLKSTAEIKGDVVALGGELEKHPDAVVEGDTVTFFFGAPDVFQELFQNGLSGLITMILIFKLISLVFWFIIAVILAAVFPRQTSLASSQIRAAFWPTFGVGLLSIIVFTGLVIFAAILTLVLIGIPILITLVTLGIAIKVFGRVIIFCFFGELMARAFNKKDPTTIAAVIFGFILVSVISLIPIIGSLFSIVISILGWGVVIRTRFGTTRNWLQRKPPVPEQAE